jgi:hypothetical protein
VITRLCAATRSFAFVSMLQTTHARSECDRPCIHGVSSTTVDVVLPSPHGAQIDGCRPCSQHHQMCPCHVRWTMPCRTGRPYWSVTQSSA